MDLRVLTDQQPDHSPSKFKNSLKRGKGRREEQSSLSSLIIQRNTWLSVLEYSILVFYF